MTATRRFSPVSRDRVKDRQTAAGGARSASLTRARLTSPSHTRVQGTLAPEPLLSDIPNAPKRTTPNTKAITHHPSASKIARQRVRLAGSV